VTGRRSLDELIADWLKGNREKVLDIIKAEEVVRNGKIELVYQDGRYIGIDVQHRIRQRRCVDK